MKNLLYLIVLLCIQPGDASAPAEFWANMQIFIKSILVVGAVSSLLIFMVAFHSLYHWLSKGTCPSYCHCCDDDDDEAQLGTNSSIRSNTPSSAMRSSSRFRRRRRNNSNNVGNSAPSISRGTSQEDQPPSYDSVMQGACFQIAGSIFVPMVNAPPSIQEGVNSSPHNSNRSDENTDASSAQETPSRPEAASPAHNNANPAV